MLTWYYFVPIGGVVLHGPHVLDVLWRIHFMVLCIIPSIMSLSLMVFLWWDNLFIFCGILYGDLMLISHSGWWFNDKLLLSLICYFELHVRKEGITLLFYVDIIYS
jgi:hypothetical protein